MSYSRMNTAQFCVLAAVLSLLVYYLSLDTLCGKDDNEFLGAKMKTAHGRYHILVTGGAGYIGSHAAQRLLRDGHSVTVLDNLSRGNIGAVQVLQRLAAPGQFQFVKVDLGNGALVKDVFRRCQFDIVMHFAAIAYVGALFHHVIMYFVVYLNWSAVPVIFRWKPMCYGTAVQRVSAAATLPACTCLGHARLGEGTLQLLYV
jgi:hypothetical protein